MSKKINIQMMVNHTSALGQDVGVDDKAKKSRRKTDFFPYVGKRKGKEQWKMVLIDSVEDFIHTVNTSHVCPTTFSYRSRNTIDLGGSMLLVDVDKPADVEAIEKVLEDYFYIKVPSASHSKKKDYKWHYFIFLKKSMHSHPNVAVDQIKRAYKELGLDKLEIDSTVYDAVRYFAPSGAKYRKNSAEWKKWVKKCDTKLSTVHYGNKYVIPAPNLALNTELVNVKKARLYDLPLHSDTDLHEKQELHSTEKEYELFNGIKSFLSVRRAFPIYMGNGEIVKVQDLYIAMKNKGINKLGMRLPCPFKNTNHSLGADSLGYGSVYLNDNDSLQIVCGGNCCEGKNVVYFPEVKPVDVKNVVPKKIIYPSSQFMGVTYKDTGKKGLKAYLMPLNMPSNMCLVPMDHEDDCDLLNIHEMIGISGGFSGEGTVHNVNLPCPFTNRTHRKLEHTQGSMLGYGKTYEGKNGVVFYTCNHVDCKNKTVVLQK